MTALTRVDSPGRYDGIPSQAYHGNLCPGPSLSSSGARMLAEECPAAFWWNCYLNPEYVVEQKTIFDLGTAAHTALLEPATWLERTVVIEADDYKTKAAQQARDRAWAEDKVPLLPKHRDQVFAMRTALLAHPLASKAWAAGKAEATYVWRDPATGMWLKCRPDFVPAHHEWVVDYKTTTDAHPRAFARKVYDMGYFQQAAWCLDGIEAVSGKMPREWWFVVQETKPPYLISVCQLDEQAIEWGRILNRRATDLFAACVQAGRWPGYAEKAVRIGLPSYAHFQLEERKEAGEFEHKPTAAMKKIALEGQAP